MDISSNKAYHFSQSIPQRRQINEHDLKNWIPNMWLNTEKMYCENFKDLSFTSQPVNTATNIAFLIAGILLINFYLKTKKKSKWISTLIILVFFIGIGSTIWHYSGTKIGKLLDVGPISLFMFVSIYYFLKKIVKMSGLKIIVSLIIFGMLSLLSLLIVKEEPFKSSAGYLPALLVLALLTYYAVKKVNLISKELFYAFITFLLAIIFRSTDFLVCNNFLIGTHFLWHILNGIFVYLLVKALIKYETASLIPQ